MSRHLGYGITATVDPQLVRELAPAVERAGLRTLWVNQPGRDGDALAALAAAAEVTSTLRLATGVLPVDLYPADDVAARVADLALPTDRLVLGIGASRRPHPLGTARDAVRTLRDELGVPVLVGALGPRMRRLAVTEADGVLLNWLTPGVAREALGDRDRDVREAGGPGGAVALYVRCALGPAAREVAHREAEKYAAIPTYAANFARHGYQPIESAVLADDAAGIRTGLEPFPDEVDELVARAVTASDGLEEHLALVDAIADRRADA
ncbi:LLM class flavin-dependent oxidoreductase [Georgenia alba]|uniref:LLM class flavin-dependent oxidoreductase n=1 Tax=Georgenia alba TaxID=2233858 RepID=A0ABW2Q4B8_9MICO